MEEKNDQVKMMVQRKPSSRWSPASTRGEPMAAVKPDLQEVLAEIQPPYTEFDLEVARDKLRAVLDRL